MGGGGGGGGGGHFAGGGAPLRSNYLAAVQEVYQYPEGWEAETVKTLKDELAERGLEPRDGDERLVIMPQPNAPRDKIVTAMIFAVAFIVIALIVASVVRYAIWEATPDPPGLNCEGADRSNPRCQ